MSPNFESFKKLHSNGSLFTLPNAWDAASALVIERLGYPAVATSSSAVAGSLGYQDGENMSFEEYLFVIRRILRSVRIPVTVDLEMGYGNTGEEILANVLTLASLGVAGINLEDSHIDKTGRHLQGAGVFAEKIAFLKQHLLDQQIDLFLNIRCDTWLLGVKDARAETRTRVTLYTATGADGIFLPCISDEEDIADAVAHTDLPVNVMWVPGLPAQDRLESLGVRRLSMGPYFYNHAYSSLEELAQSFIHHTNQLA